MRIDKDLTGKLVTIKFLDHAAFDQELCICRCAGWIVEVKEKHIVLAWWDLLDDTQETTENNREYCSIITSAIEEIKVLD